jgi:hypothetical protein
LEDSARFAVPPADRNPYLETKEQLEDHARFVRRIVHALEHKGDLEHVIAELRTAIRLRPD